MTDPTHYCAPFFATCHTMQEWAVYWQALGVVAAVVFGAVGLYKIYHELQRLNEQRAKETHDKDVAARLKRTEFFLSQHRRLFDDEDLYDILCLIETNHPRLANDELWHKKRKFLVFFEEIALLVKSQQINPDVAYYMFGYYTLRVKTSSNFTCNINPSKEHWALFDEFSDRAKQFLKEHPQGPPTKITL